VVRATVRGKKAYGVPGALQGAGRYWAGITRPTVTGEKETTYPLDWGPDIMALPPMTSSYRRKID